MKTLSFRATDKDLERIEQIKETYSREYCVKLNNSDVITAAIMKLWDHECTPYLKDGKLTF